jgi:filamentous hemagglutinin family protein
MKSLNRAFRAEEGITARKYASKSSLEIADYVRGCCRLQDVSQDHCSLLRILIAALAVLPFSMPSVLVHAQPPAQLPVEPTVVHGVATVDTAGGHMTVTNSPNAIINWQDFSIGAEQGVHFNQLDATSQVLNRVTGDDPSKILGSLSSNGGVWLINPHGVLFGENARIDVAGLVTSTLDISNIDFMAGKYNFLPSGTNSGQVTNQGHIHTTFGGRVWLIGGQVRNEGLIQTAGGNTVLAAGKSVELIDSGAPNVVVRVSAPENEAVNLGSLVATGGSVDVHGSIVNQSGIIRADSVGADSSGRIALTASQGLTLADNSVTGASGGNVTMTGGTSTYLAGLVDVSRQQGTGGDIQINTGILEGMASGSMRADGEQGGNIRVEGSGLVAFSSTLSAIGKATGGKISVTGDQVHLQNADVDASGGIRGGIVHLGGGWQGGGDLPHSRQMLIGAGSEVKANGGDGILNPNAKGGEIAIWSTQSSQHYGLLQARDGGRIELSSRGEIFQRGAIQAGRGGSVLFDPKNLIITNSPPGDPPVDAIDENQATFAFNPSGDSYITPANFTDSLSSGSAVTLQANNDITVLSNVVSFSDGQGGGDLTLQAGRNITFAANIFTDNGNLTAVAGAAGADVNFLDPGAPTLTINNDVSLNVGSATVTLAAVSGNFINNNGDAAILTSGEEGRWLIYAADPGTSTEGFSGYNKHYNQNFGPTPSYAANGNWFLYSLAPILLVTPSTQTVTYGNAIPAFNPNISGLIDEDATAGLGASTADWTIGGSTSSSGNFAAGLHNVAYAGGLSSNLGYQFADNPAGNNELVVNAREVTADAVTVQNKIYDGLTVASLSSGSLVDVISGDGESPGDSVTLSAAFNNKNVGIDKPVTLGLSGPDSGNYTLAPFSPVPVADILPRSLAVTGFTAQDKIYDGNTNAIIAGGSLTGLVAGDTVSFSGAIGRFDNKNVGVNKPVSIFGVTLDGVDGGNYVLSASDIASTTADITSGTLTYVADPAIRLAGLSISGLTGIVTGFVEGDSQQADTNGILVWTTPATAASPAGAHAINGGGLSAINYIFQQAESNATALTLLEGVNNPANNPPFKQNTLDTSVQSINAAMYGSFPVLDAVTTGFVIDMAAMRVPRFGRLDLSRMSRDEMRRLIEERREFKEKLFADAIYKLELDPSLANVPLCPSLTDANTGLCRLTDAQRLAQASKVTREEPSRTHRKTKVARLPQIERKFVVLFGTDQYADKGIPPLENAIFDAETVGKLFADKLGYEVKVVKNATKADIVRTLNQLSTEMQAQDSVIIYYAGHGYRNEKTGGGYWIPADASVTDPTTWISNTDVSSMMSDISAKQMVMIADSCYSGTFAEQKLGMGGTGIKPDEVLAKRSVIVMSSGGDEPVADEGKEGHSIFAWDLMQALRDVDNWQPGTTIFEQVKREVMKSFPQTPQYGAVKSAGHEAGGEYLFEFRQLE